MQLLNIENTDRIVHLFCRDKEGQQVIVHDNDFFPFFYEPEAKNPDAVSYTGEPLKRVWGSEPKDVKDMRSKQSWSSDVRYPIVYLTHKLEAIHKTVIKYFFIDIEVFCSDLPDIKNPVDPISCITVYNSLSKEYKTFFLNDYTGNMDKQEHQLLSDFNSYMRQEKPDLWLSWNVDFDYQYLYYREEYLYNKKWIWEAKKKNSNYFPKQISPLYSLRKKYSTRRHSRVDDMGYPAGISILDYLSMFRKVNMREPSYKLDTVCEKYLGQGKKHKEVEFQTIDETLKQRNIEDVELLVKLEEKFKIIDYFNEIRIFSKSLWEDLTHNSFILDSIIMSEAKRRKVVLPNKTKKEDREEETLTGAYRRSESGAFFNIYKADVASMYPNQLVNFCLDTTNIVEKDSSDSINVNGVRFKQNPDAIIPYISTKLMNEKASLKKQLKESKLGSEENKIIQMKYDAYKGLVNSLFGVMGFPSFRLYDNRVASAITFLARDLLQYVEQEMSKQGYEVIYTDTDAIMYKSNEDKIDLLNEMVQTWAKETYGKDKVDIVFESEGKFTKLLVLGKCHYFGYIDTPKGLKKEVKGVEVKRSSSSKYESYFQENLIEKVLNKESKDRVLSWIAREKRRIKTLPITEVGFPCKLANKKYKNEPIFKRAYDNTRMRQKNFKLSFGEIFYYIYIKSMGKNSKGKNIDVLAFTKEDNSFIDSGAIDWRQIISRNIEMKVDAIFEAIKWKSSKPNFQPASLF